MAVGGRLLVKEATRSTGITPAPPPPGIRDLKLTQAIWKMPRDLPGVVGGLAMSERQQQSPGSEEGPQEGGCGSRQHGRGCSPAELGPGLTTHGAASVRLRGEDTFTSPRLCLEEAPLGPLAKEAL